MITMTKRNLKLYFRDRTGVFFSLLGVLIIIGLYVLFLSDTVSSGVDLPGVKYLMDSWIMAGVLGVAPITTTMGAFGVMIEDRTRKVSKDFSASPLSRSSLTSGYICSSFLIGIIMTLVSLLFAEIYIVSGGGSWLSISPLIEVFGLILVSSLSASAFVFFLVCFFKTTNAFVTASTILGTLVGFLTGVYIPIGILPEAMQAVIKFFPLSHGVSLLRQVMMRDAISVSFSGVPAEPLAAFEKQMGVTYEIGGAVVTPVVSLLILVGSAALFYTLALWRVSRKTK